MSGIISKTANLLTGAQEGVEFSQPQAEAAQRRAAEMQARFGRFGVESPLGTVSYTIDPQTGSPIATYGMSEADIQRQQLIQQGLGGISLDPTQAQEAYYQQATRQLIPQQQRDVERLESTLAGRGIGMGTEQYERQLENLRSQQAGTLADIQNRAVFAGQDLLGSQIGNIGALAGQRDIGALAGLGGGTGAQFASTYEAALANQQANIAAQNERNRQLMGQLGMGAMGFSDRRLKDNLEPVGKLDNGLTVYVGNYKPETGLDTTPQLFLIAQEVQEVKPEAVGEKDDFLAVDYKEAVK